jgi:sulfur-oxidizing protein SoxZ
VAARIQIAEGAKRGDLVEVRILIQHAMETGFRRDDVGEAIPANTVKELVCRYNGIEVFRAELFPGISANPYLQFYTVADTSGELVFEWADDAGGKWSERAEIRVAG